MRSFLLTLFMLLSFQFQANAQELEIINSVSNPESVSPQFITSFNDKVLSNTYVSVVSNLVGGAWLTQEIFVNVGYQEEASDTFSFTIVGEVINVVISEDFGDGSLYITVTTNTGAWSQEGGGFTPGFTTKLIRILKDKNTDTGYATSAEVETVYYSPK